MAPGAPTVGFHSVQCAELPGAPGALSRWGTAEALIELLHAYFATADRTVGWLVRTRWENGAPTLAIGGSSVDLVAMGTPSVELSAERSAISVVVRGLVVRPMSRARLTIALDAHGPHVCATVELVGYEPRGGNRRAVRWLYLATQARLHVWVGDRFLDGLRRRWYGGSPRGGGYLI